MVRKDIGMSLMLLAGLVVMLPPATIAYADPPGTVSLSGTTTR